MSNFYPDLNFTNFPDSVDNFKKWLDIVAQDGPLIKEYMEAVQRGDSISAAQALGKIPNGTQKIISAIDLNKLSQAILAVERLFKSDVKGYIENKQKEWDYSIGQFSYQGDWESGKSYLENNLVSYTVYGIQYIYIATSSVPSSIPPTNTEYWRQITIQGPQGESGQGLSYRYYWEISDNYYINDAVTYDGALWMAVKPSKGIVPSQSTSEWRLIMSLSATSYPIQETQPSNQLSGDLWFNTSDNPTKFYYLQSLSNPAQSKDIASGKEAYDYLGRRIVGTGNIDSLFWNSDSPTRIVWN